VLEELNLNYDFLLAGAWRGHGLDAVVDQLPLLGPAPLDRGPVDAKRRFQDSGRFDQQPEPVAVVLESVMVVQGDAIVDIDGVRTHLHTFDTTLVPANIAHYFENASDTAPMRILWTYASVEATRTLVQPGTSSRIDAEHDQETTPANPVHEIARITVRSGHETEFEAAVAAAVPLFQGTHGARSLVLERSHEHPGAYRLVVAWDSIDDHRRSRNGEP
jgi:hypothetical protein